MSGTACVARKKRMELSDDALNTREWSAPTLTEREQRRNGQLCPIRRIRPESMTRGSGIEDEAGRPERSGYVERQCFLYSPSNAGGAVDVTPLEQFESSITHTSSALSHDHLIYIGA